MTTIDHTAFCLLTTLLNCSSLYPVLPPPFPYFHASFHPFFLLFPRAASWAGFTLVGMSQGEAPSALWAGSVIWLGPGQGWQITNWISTERPVGPEPCHPLESGVSAVTPWFCGAQDTNHNPCWHPVLWGCGFTPNCDFPSTAPRQTVCDCRPLPSAF